MQVYSTDNWISVIHVVQGTSETYEESYEGSYNQELQFLSSKEELHRSEVLEILLAIG